MSRTRALVLAGLVTGVLPPFVPAADSDAKSRIGRLFSSPEQRLELDRIRDNPVSAKISAPVLHPTGRESLPSPERDTPALAATLNGVVVRSDGHRLAWIDGIEAAVGGETPAGVRVEADHRRGGLLGIRLSSGRTSAVLEPGQSVDENGRVRNGYERRSTVLAAGAPAEVAADSARADQGAAAPAGLLQPDSRPLPAHHAQEQMREAQTLLATSGERAPGARNSGDRQPMATSSTGRESAEW